MPATDTIERTTFEGASQREELSVPASGASTCCTDRPAWPIAGDAAAGAQGKAAAGNRCSRPVACMYRDQSGR